DGQGVGLSPGDVLGEAGAGVDHVVQVGEQVEPGLLLLAREDEAGELLVPVHPVVALRVALGQVVPQHVSLGQPADVPLARAAALRVSIRRYRSVWVPLSPVSANEVIHSFRTMWS